VTLLYGIAAVVVLWWFLTNFAHANTAALAKFIRIVGGVLGLGAAVLLGVRGRIDMALLLGSFGVWLLGWGKFRIPGLGGRTSRTPGSISRVRSSIIEMELDHDTGDMDGSVLAGAFEGQRLNSLGETSLQHLLTECQACDPDGVRLLEAYLDRRFPLWRESARSNEEVEPETQPASGTMTAEEAYQVLGLPPNASQDEIRQAHRKLMKKFHPDQGGTAYLAARINRAREVLLGRRC
jgi:hypothetical protein